MIEYIINYGSSRDLAYNDLPNWLDLHKDKNEELEFSDGDYSNEFEDVSENEVDYGNEFEDVSDNETNYNDNYDFFEYISENDSYYDDSELSDIDIDPVPKYSFEKNNEFYLGRPTHILMREFDSGLVPKYVKVLHVHDDGMFRLDVIDLLQHIFSIENIIEEINFCSSSEFYYHDVDQVIKIIQIADVPKINLMLSEIYTENDVSLLANAVTKLPNLTNLKITSEIVLLNSFLENMHNCTNIKSLKIEVICKPNYNKENIAKELINLFQIVGKTQLNSFELVLPQNLILPATVQPIFESALIKAFKENYSIQHTDFCLCFDGENYTHSTFLDNIIDRNLQIA